MTARKAQTAQRVEVCILAGGKSSRMGVDKSRLRLGRRTMLGHIGASANAAGFRSRVIRADLVPRCGPLAGVYSALATSRAEAILFLSCDMPFISTKLLRALSGKLGPRTKALFVAERGRVGFPFLLRHSALPVVEGQLARRQLSLQRLARVLRAQTVSLPPGQANELFNINTPEDWEMARARWRQSKQIPKSKHPAPEKPQGPSFKQL